MRIRKFRSAEMTMMSWPSRRNTLSVSNQPLTTRTKRSTMTCKNKWRMKSWLTARKAPPRENKTTLTVLVSSLSYQQCLSTTQSSTQKIPSWVSSSVQCSCPKAMRRYTPTLTQVILSRTNLPMFNTRFKNSKTSIATSKAPCFWGYSKNQEITISEL